MEPLTMFFGEAVLHLALGLWLWLSDTGLDFLLPGLDSSDSEFELLGNLAAGMFCLKVTEVGIR